MQKIHFVGYILPRAVKISTVAPDLTWKMEEAGLNPTFRAKIENSIINVECELETYRPEDFIDLYRRALDLARATVNVVAFAQGYGVTVVFETVILPDGTPSEIVITDPRLPPLCTAYSIDPAKLADFLTVRNTVISSPDLFMALEDLIQAITLPHVAPVNCARAMDRLKHSIATPTANDKQGWNEMRSALRIDEPYIKFITEVSKNPRHGRPGHTSGDLTSDATIRSWTIMNRFFEYLKRERKPLPEAEFPLLTE